MAIDTAAKRASVLGVDDAAFGLYLPSSGGIDAASERQAVAHAYNGIAATTAASGRGIRWDRRRRFIAAED